MEVCFQNKCQAWAACPRRNKSTLLRVTRGPMVGSYLNLLTNSRPSNALAVPGNSAGGTSQVPQRRDDRRRFRLRISQGSRFLRDWRPSTPRRSSVG